MNILALDLGTTTGWAYWDKKGIHSGSESFKLPNKFKGDLGLKFGKFQSWLPSLLWDCSAYGEPDIVYFEQVMSHAGMKAAHAYGGFLAILQIMASRCGIPCVGIPVGTIKKHITGKGNATKHEVIQAVERLGHRPACDNEADALALLYTVKDSHKGDEK